MTGNEGANMTNRIRDGLSDESMVAWVLDEEPTQTRELTLPQLSDWRLVEIRATGRRAFMWVIAYMPEGEPRTIVLTGKPDRWTQLTDGASVEDGAAAVAVARAWYDSTRRTSELWYRAESVDDIDWQGHVDEDSVAHLKHTYRETIRPPAVTRVDDGGWILSLWTVQQGDLVRHDLVVGDDASVLDTTETMEESMPVSVAV